jgi:RHS repeat-associated protein
VNNCNQYTKVGSLLVSSDKNGNLTSDQNGTTYDYDAQNRLIRVETKGSNPTVVTMAYDARNRVVSRTINGDETTYVYDGWTLINEYDSYGIEDAHYIHGPAIDEILTHNATLGGAAYYTQDGNGNVTTITSSSGAVQERYTYDVYGTPTITTSTGVIVSSSAVGNRFLFTGREYLAEIGLYDYRNRVYSPGLGRFLQTDPIRFDAGDINIYRYVGNNPVNWRDPSGEFWNAGGGIAKITTSSGRQLSSSSVPALKQTLQNIINQGDTVTSIDITGHGAPSLQTLGDGFLTTNPDYVNGGTLVLDDNGNDLTNLLNAALDPNANINLGGCNTAKGNNSVAQGFSAAFPNANVTGHVGPAFGISGLGSVGIISRFRGGVRQ